MLTGPGLSQRDMINASLAGFASALLFLASAGSVLLGLVLYMMAAMPIYGVALHAGGLLTLMAGGIGAAVVSAFVEPLASIGAYFGSIALAPIAVAWVVAGETRRRAPLDGRSTGKAVAVICIIGALLSASIVVAIEQRAGQAGATSQAIREAWTAAVDSLMTTAPAAPGASRADQRQAMLDQFDALGAGAVEMAMTEMWVALQVLSAAIVLKVAGKSGATPPVARLSSLVAPRWLLGAAALAGVLAMAMGEARIAAMVVLAALMMPFLLEGLALVHLISRNWPARRLALALIYILTIFLPLARMIVTLAGLADHWTGWRERALAGTDKGA